MIKQVVTTAALSIAANAVDYNFPSHAIPGNVPVDQVKQIVSFIWDDNAYSGLERTHYETEPGQMFADQSWIGGERPWGATAPNKLNLQPGETGMSWSFTTLAGRKNDLPPARFDPANENIRAGMQFTHNDTIWESAGWTDGSIAPSLHPRYPEVNGDWEHPWKYISTLEDFTRDGIVKTNPDGSPILFTYNMITGLFVSQFADPRHPEKATGDDGYMYRVTKYGYWQVNEKDKIEFPHLSVYTSNDQVVPAVWGREQPVKVNWEDEGNVHGETYGQINNATQMAFDFGHEMGNHTLDHMETNSPLTSGPEGYGRWGGEGFHGERTHRVRIGSDIIGWNEYDWDEAEAFGRTPGISWHEMGWIPYAGRQISQRAWEGVLKIGEEPYIDYFGWKPRRDGGPIVGFRAPRLEVNSAMFFALANLGYLYDNGLEEGMCETIDGTNFVWPYTMDNGSPNTFQMRKSGYTNVAIDSLPVRSGLWQYPVTNVITHPDDRSSVYDAYATIMAAQGEDVSNYKDAWMQHGKITGFDFNMFILWGMTGPQAERALKHTLGLRLEGNRAPFQVGLHTDYFSPIYDVATLMAPENASTFGLALNYNTWDTRQKALENFVDYAIGRGAHFWTGERTIEYVRELLSRGTRGDKTLDIEPSEWTLMTENGAATGDQTRSNLVNTDITIKSGWDSWGGYYANLDGSKMGGFSHIELDYRTNAPLYLTLIYQDGSRRDVLLNNLGVDVESGLIPYQAFANAETGESTVLDPTNIIGIAIYPQKVSDREEKLSFTVRNIRAYTGNETSLADNSHRINTDAIAINGIGNGQMNISVQHSGVYNINIYSANGRLVRRLQSQDLINGANGLHIGSLSAGIYNVEVIGTNNTLRYVGKTRVF